MNKKMTPHVIVLGALVAFITVFGSACAMFSRGTTVVDLFWDTALLQNVTRLTDDGITKSWARVSPDGERLLYMEEDRGRQNIFLLRDVNVPAKTPLINDALALGWHDNSENFFFIDRDHRLVRSGTAGGGRTFVTRNPVGARDSNPTIRRGAILLDTEMGGRRQIVSMRENGTEITFLGDGMNPSWHPTEPRFVFIRGRSVFEMDLASLQATQLFDPGAGSWAGNPQFAGNGEFIIFQVSAVQEITGTAVQRAGGRAVRAMRVTGEQRNRQLFMMRANGTEISTLTVPEVDTFSLSWDEVNGFAYFISNATGRTEIFRARINFD